MRFVGVAAALQHNAAFRWPRLITAHEKRWQWQHDPCDPIHYAESCILPPPRDTTVLQIQGDVRARRSRGRVAGWGRHVARRGVVFYWQVWWTNACNLWFIHWGNIVFASVLEHYCEETNLPMWTSAMNVKYHNTGVDRFFKWRNCANHEGRNCWLEVCKCNYTI